MLTGCKSHGEHAHRTPVGGVQPKDGRARFSFTGASRSPLIGGIAAAVSLRSGLACPPLAERHIHDQPWRRPRPRFSRAVKDLLALIV
jgi:hypothetical protein